jgi:hypothetical protein
LHRTLANPHEKSSLVTIGAVAHDFSNVHLLRADEPFYLEDGTVRYSAGRSFLYADDDHLSDAGAEVLRDLTTRAILAAVTGSNRIVTQSSKPWN